MLMTHFKTLPSSASEVLMSELGKTNQPSPSQGGRAETKRELTPALVLSTPSIPAEAT